MIESMIRHQIVQTCNGPVEGKNYTSHYGDEAYAFQRIPYMKPPIGKLRFKDPVPVDNWTEVLDATQNVSSVPQIDFLQNKYVGNETELYINVYTKNLKPSKLQAIAVSIHGGGFICGSSSNDMLGPDNFLRDDIVFFSFNYRLSVLGFLSFDDPDLMVPGNAGLKDQTLALKWINKNAERFGGNPNNITLFGLSAGGASVNYHLVSEMSRDLFHKAIVMSGAVLNTWASVPNKAFSLRLAKKFGWNENDSTSKALEILQNVPAEELIMMQNTIITNEEKRERIYAAFLPSIEPYVSEQCFLTEPIINMLPKQWSHNIPIIIGATTDEGNMLWFAWDNISQYPEGADYIGDFKYLVPFELGLGRNSEECKKLGNQIRSFYFDEEQLNFGDKQTLGKFLNLMSDKFFLYGIFATIKSRVSDGISSAPTYLYRFNYSSDAFDYSRIFSTIKPIDGVGHGADISYIYSSLIYETLERDSPEWDKVKQISSLWNNFVMTGNPNSPEIMPTIWEPVSSDTLVKCLNISDKLKMIDYPELFRMNFWHALFEQATS